MITVAALSVLSSRHIQLYTIIISTSPSLYLEEILFFLPGALLPSLLEVGSSVLPAFFREHRGFACYGLLCIVEVRTLQT